MRKANQKTGVKQWIHPPQALTSGHVVYNVKLLGKTVVDSSKGSDVVREAVRKLKFNKQLKRTEGEKPLKVELTISASGVGIQNRQTKGKLHTFPLHRISYCADDKSDKKICAFIAKEGSNDTHVCFVMESEKAAEDITLTVGQAFDLAYQNFMAGSGKEVELNKQVVSLQKKVRDLEEENAKLRQRLVEVSTAQHLNQPAQHLPPAYSEHTSTPQMPPPSQPPQMDLFEAAPFTGPANGSPGAPQGAAMTVPTQGNVSTNGTNGALYAVPNRPGASEMAAVPAIPPPQSSTRRSRAQTHPIPEPFSPTSLFPATDAFTSSPTASSPTPTNSTSRPRPHGVASPIQPGIAPPPKSSRSRAGTAPGTPSRPMGQPGGAASDPFGQAPFSAPSPQQASGAAPGGPAPASGALAMDIDNQIFRMDNQMKEMQEGFERGLSIGTENFSLADFDPLNH